MGSLVIVRSGFPGLDRVPRDAGIYPVEARAVAEALERAGWRVEFADAVPKFVAMDEDVWLPVLRFEDPVPGERAAGAVSALVDALDAGGKLHLEYHRRTGDGHVENLRASGTAADLRGLLATVARES
ncbi:hypothetical protein Afil01_50460 [Actinorhabdospora filicis]|uniref:Uncharacterized protein n=1 Tax=Actinorhabdospora filicis TaxID=1785913 RepID=A0A9W6WB33_9ACTN|nr:hypothetical protein [Actinorhabdospora filicis]GLZ80239.1 hypothetical protein Afil01_50460 [Actinorhabdospora filicis]